VNNIRVKIEWPLIDGIGHIDMVEYSTPSYNKKTKIEVRWYEYDYDYD